MHTKERQDRTGQDGIKGPKDNMTKDFKDKRKRHTFTKGQNYKGLKGKREKGQNYKKGQMDKKHSNVQIKLRGEGMSTEGQLGEK